MHRIAVTARHWSIVRRMTAGVALVVACLFVVEAAVAWVWIRPLADGWALGLAWLAAACATLLAVNFTATRLVAQPISRLAEELRGSEGRMQPIAVDAYDSAEMRKLVRSYNLMARSAQDARDGQHRLLAGVSHDLRSAMNRLRMRVETACEGRVAESMHSDFAMLERILSQFMAYARGTAHEDPTTWEPLDDNVRAVVEEYSAHSLLGPRVLGPRVLGPHEQGPHPISLHLEATGAVAPALPLRRLLGNLIENAIAHGRAPIEVSLVPEAKRLVLSVRDHGKGMTPEDFARAQMPFVQLQSADRAATHSGLGLAIVSQIAREWGATLAAHPRTDAHPFAISVAIPRESLRAEAPSGITPQHTAS